MQCEAAFQHAYAGWSPSPTFEMTYSYGYPAFKVIFRSKSERDAAERAGANTAFAHAIQDLCGNRGPQSHPFRAEQAIFFGYAGYVEEMLTRMRS
jgi:hypothetical protein